MSSWYLFVRKRLSQEALRFIRHAVDSGRPAYISAISIVETIYLIERGRIPLEAIQRLEAGLKDPASGLHVAPVDEEVAQAVHKVPRDLVPDMPDRIIAATALHLGLPLITRDHRMQSAGICTQSRAIALEAAKACNQSPRFLKSDCNYGEVLRALEMAFS